MMRPLTPRDLDAVFAQLTNLVTTMYAEFETLQPQVLMVWMGDVEGQVHDIHVLPTELTLPFFMDDRGKDRLMAFTAIALSDDGGPPGSRPSLVAHFSEAWVVRGDSETATPTGSIEHHPARTEGVAVFLHTRFGTTPRLFPIDPATRTLLPALPPPRHAQGRMQVGEWLPDQDKARH